eukprot:3660404-Pyramimonas_sp.AAC.1
MRGLPLPHAPFTEPGRGAPRSVGAPRMAHDGPKMASNNARWPTRWLKIAHDRSRRPPRCPNGPQDRPTI